ncbi:MAG TPA: hypothetical protein VFI08_09325 [Spirochaetia bacterium]|nr:hypothetical protein [Spirochaetia bacterium]
MRKYLAVLLLLATGGMAFATSYNEIPFIPMSPESLGSGGSEISDARGWDALFTNPAGFSRDPSAFTLSSSTAWVYARPDQLVNLVGQMASGASSSSALINFMNNQVTAGGIGAGASWGIGYVGGGLGLGAALVLDSVLNGPSLLGVAGDPRTGNGNGLTATLGFIGGLAIPFDVAGFKVHAGGDVRPMIRVHTLLTNSVAVSMLNALANGNDVLATLGTAPALYGVGIGIDLGAIAELGWFTVGLTIRDLGGTQFRYNTAQFDVVENTLSSSLQFPTTGSLASDQWVIPMDIGIGTTFHPDLGTLANVVDPSVSVEMRNLVGALAGQTSPWTVLHIGLETRLFSFFTLRTGLNQGYLTAGAGVKFLVFDLNFAVFTRELGVHVGDKPLSGMTIDSSIRW